MPIKHEPGSYRIRQSKSTLDSEFMGGTRQNQTTDGSRQKSTRDSRMKGKGMDQPVKSGTYARQHAPYKGDRV